ncbi:MAG: HAD domain-containing protein [Polyangiaceae bacterium]
MDALIFLDIDGVLNRLTDAPAPTASAELWTPEDIDPVAVQSLNGLIRRTTARIVISSSWRLHHSVPELVSLLDGRGLSGEIVGVTPRMSGEPRGVEIRTWLAANARPEAAFVVLDDEAPSAGLDGHWVRTDPAVGLSEDDIDTAVTILSLPSSLRAGR